jgi:hypothetical protein
VRTKFKKKWRGVAAAFGCPVSGIEYVIVAPDAASLTRILVNPPRFSTPANVDKSKFTRAKVIPDPD